MEKPEDSKELIVQLIELTSGRKKPKILLEEVVPATALGKLVPEKYPEPPGPEYHPVKVNGKYGYQDGEGRIVIEPAFDKACYFSEGLATVKRGKKWGMIDEQGYCVWPPRKLQYLGRLCNGLAFFGENHKYGFLDRQGQVRIEAQFDLPAEFSEGLCAVFRYDKDKFGFIDTTGNLIIGYRFQDVHRFENGQAEVQVDGLWGTIDKAGNFLIAPVHKDCSALHIFMTKRSLGLL